MKKNAVLVIDDEFPVRESLKITLQDEYRVYLAPGGKEGLEILKKEEIDAVVLDIRMPQLNGIEVFKKIRERDDSLPVIILTAFGSLSSAQEAVKLGAFRYLTKPVDVNDFKQIVEAAVKKRRLAIETETGLKELEKLNRELKQGLVESSRLASVGTISAALLHEIKNPLTVIMGYVDLLSQQVVEGQEKRSLSEGELERYVSIIKREVDRCARMSKKYLEFSSLKRDQMQQTDLNELIQESLELIEIQAAKSNIGIERKFTERLQPLTCHRDMIKQVFINIGLNALEALTPGGKVVVGSARSSESGQQWLETVFEDTGPGIPAKILENLFQPFSSTKKGKEGGGLGLVVSKQIVEEHGGKIEISSRAGSGTRVRVLLPL